MTDYNYYEAINNDVRRAIRDNYDLNEWRGDREGLEERLNDDLWLDDTVTGNASGSYAFCAYTAMGYTTGNMDLLADAVADFCISYEDVGRRLLSAEWEWFDILIRCHLLSGAISDVLDDLEEAGQFDEPGATVLPVPDTLEPPTT